MFKTRVALLACLLTVQAHSQLLGVLGGGGAPAPMSTFPAVADGVTATVDLDFVANTGYNNGTTGTAVSMITVSRNQANTNLLPSSPVGFASTTFPANTARIDANGLLVEPSRINQLFPSFPPGNTTLTTGSLANGTYTLWVACSSGSPGCTATLGNGTSTTCSSGSQAVQGTAITFTTSGTAGTCTVTTAGTPVGVQLELGGTGSSLIPTTSAAVTRPAEVVTLTGTVASGTGATVFTSAQTFQLASAGPALGGYSDNTTSNRMYNTIQTGGNAQSAVTFTTGGTQCNNFMGTFVLSAVGKMALAYGSGGNSSYNGSAPATCSPGSTALTAGLLTTLNIGGNVGAFLGGYVKRTALWPSTRISNPTLQAMTQ